MGAVCSCFGASSDHGDSTNDAPCFCFDCCVQKIKNKIRGGPATVPPLNNNNSAPITDSRVELSSSSTVVSSNRENQKYSRVPPHEEEAVAASASRSQDKSGSGHERRDGDDAQDGSRSKSLTQQEDDSKLSDASNGKLLKDGESEGSTEYYSFEFDIGHSQLAMDLEDEDFCPTCLDGYTLENPKIVTECSHHYHLGCIYEWKERSESCPVCGKLMAFDEMV